MYYDLLAKIKNAGMASKATFVTPFSKADFAVAETLKRAGYLREVQKKDIGRHSSIEIKLLRKGKGSGLRGFKIMSKPSRHFYVSHKSIKPVMSGYGLAVISTSKGIMTDKEARKNKIGGEYLFELW